MYYKPAFERGFDSLASNATPVVGLVDSGIFAVVSVLPVRKYLDCQYIAYKPRKKRNSALV